MTFGDVGNGTFELVGGLVVWQNVRRIRCDKQIRGADWRVTAFFTFWCGWNLWYYPSLNQWLSFVGAFAVGVANATWLFYAIKYRKR
jgi:hypothetical protein